MFEDHVQAVLGEQYGHALRVGQFTRQAHERVAFVGGHAGGGFVHQQQLRPVRQRHGQLDPLDVAVGQGAAVRAGLGGHPHLFQ